MTEEQRNRHNVRQGLTGLAQVNGRNAISWEQKLEYDLEYVKSITIWKDVAIFFKTIGKVLGQRDVNREGTVSDMDLGDWLIKEGKVNEDTYRAKQDEAEEILAVFKR